MSRTKKRDATRPEPTTYIAHTSYITCADAAARVAHLFTLAHLNEIISRIKCPPVEDTPSTQEILLQERLAIFDREQFLNQSKLEPNAIIIDPDFPEVDEKISRLEAALPKDWKRFREQLEHLKNKHRAYIDDSTDSGWLSEVDKNYFEETLSKLQAVSSILDELRPQFCEMPRSQGQHGAMGLLNIELATTIFFLLPTAWQEAGVNKHISATKRYQIVQECLGRVGENVGIDAIRKALKKHPAPSGRRTEIVDGNSP
ncbi:MAG: hypothetical protein KGL63_15165 [Betaproteobacteria bacterium]|nr:hypothetical protein [Betaproteobacteria bacterium]